MDHHPMVEAYLADLDRALSGSDPREHAETMSAIREHLADAIAPDATAEQVRHALDELGPVETIAASTTQSTSTPGRPGIDGLAISALIALVTGIAHLRTTRQGKPLAWAAVVISALTLVTSLVLAMTLLASNNSLKPQQPRPVQSTQQPTP